MYKQETIKLWARRWTTSYGWVWQLCRECYVSDKDAWLKYWVRDEPTVEFRFSNKKPK